VSGQEEQEREQRTSGKKEEGVEGSIVMRQRSGGEECVWKRGGFKQHLPYLAAFIVKLILFSCTILFAVCLLFSQKSKKTLRPDMSKSQKKKRTRREKKKEPSLFLLSQQICVCAFGGEVHGTRFPTAVTAALSFFLP
jgi:hypothetical protein